MTNKVYALMYIDANESHTYSLYSSMKSALKSGLTMIQKQSIDKLTAQRNYPEDFDKNFYREIIGFTKDYSSGTLHIEEMVVYD